MKKIILNFILFSCIILNGMGKYETFPTTETSLGSSESRQRRDEVSCASGKEEYLKIHFLDVGEGDSIFVETPNKQTVIIDAGNVITGLNVVNYLRKHNVHNIDHLIFTHPHPDHFGGAFWVIQMMKVKSIYDNGEDLSEMIKSQDVYRWYEELARKRDNYKTLRGDETLDVDGVILRVIWPPRQLIFSDFNANSLVIMVEYKKFRCLLTGDLNIQGEQELLKEKEGLKASVLKTGHHGAGDATSEEFLNRVSPEICIISVDENNVRGYPSTDILERLNVHNCRVYQTAKQGSIVVKVDEDGGIIAEPENEN